jgi:hypothetical protein
MALVDQRGGGGTVASMRDPDLKKSSQPSHSLSTASDLTSPCAQGAIYTPLDKKLTKDRYWYLQQAIARLHSRVPVSLEFSTWRLYREDGPHPFVAFNP